MYSFIDRLGLEENDNLINYYVGVFEIKLNIPEKEIIINYNLLWKKNINEILNTTKNAWEYKEEDIKKISDSQIIINMNFEILINYLDKIIIFI